MVVGSKAVREASGIITLDMADGILVGVQFRALFHAVLTLPFQVDVDVSALAILPSHCPKVEGSK